MIPDFKTYLKESLWADVQSQASGDVVKKEDDFKSIDLGDHCNVYFADKDFICDDWDVFSASEIKKLKFPQGWRLPKEEELTGAIYKNINRNDRLQKNVAVHLFYNDSLTIEGKHTGEELVFNLNGYERQYYWCEGENNAVEIGSVPVGAGDEYFMYGVSQLSIPGRIRLVKDKSLKESLWADVQNQASGDTVKKEDDLEWMDINEFREYCKNRYWVDPRAEGIGITTTSDSKYLGVPGFLGKYFLFFYLRYMNSGKKTIDFVNGVLDHLPEVKKKLEDRYDLRRRPGSTDRFPGYLLFPKNGSPVTNALFIDMLDYLDSSEDLNSVPNLKKYYHKNEDINESLWADVQNQAAGDTIKKEDDLNNLDITEFHKYLKDRYKTPDGSPGKFKDGSDIYHIGVPLDTDRTDSTNFLFLDYYMDPCEVSIDRYFYDENAGMREKLKKEYRVKKQNVDYDIIYPKDGSPADQNFFVEVLEFIIDNMGSRPKGIQRIVNESLWAEVQSQAAGDTLKKEDNLNRLDREAFFEYLKGRYVSDAYKIDMFKDGEGVYHICIPLEEDISGTINLLYLDYEKKPEITLDTDFYNANIDIGSELKMNYTVKKQNSDFDLIYPNDGRPVDQNFFVEILDFIIDNCRNMKKGIKRRVTESLWADVQSQAAGDVVKKEDDLNTLSSERFIQYIKDHYRVSNFGIHLKENNVIHIPFIRPRSWAYNIVYRFDEERVVLSWDFDRYYPSLFRKISETYNVEKIKIEEDDEVTSYYMVSPKTGKVDNNFVIELLNFVIDDRDANLIIDRL